MNNTKNNLHQYPDIKKFILELRIDILNISIEKFISSMNWKNEKYYCQIINGYKDKNNILKYKNPTISFLFKGIAFAMENDDLWKSKKNEINDLIIRTLIIWK